MVRFVIPARVIVAGLLTMGVACGGRQSRDDRFVASATAQTFPIEGTVRGVDIAEGRITLEHGPIGDYMDAMTMSFALKESWAPGVATPGDHLTGTFVVDGSRSWIEGVSLTKPPEGAQKAGSAEASETGIGPEPGTPLPAVPLRDQAGRVVRAQDFAGRQVILTFIYTRCPVPDYCPRMLERLNEAASRLRKAGRRDEVQLIAISIDPEHDTPEVLSEYGRRVIEGEEGDPFHRWSFLTGTREQVLAWAGFFALTFEKDGPEIAHGLRTAVVDRQGRVVGVLRSNDWTTNDLMALLSSAES